jgi:hypothetical protein
MGLDASKLLEDGVRRVAEDPRALATSPGPSTA